MAESVQLNFRFLITPHGIMKLIQIIFSFTVCILVGTFCGSIGPFGFCASVSAFYGRAKFEWQALVLTVFATTMIISFIQLILHFFNLTKVWENVNWRKGEMIYAAIAFILCLICAGLEIYFSIAIENDTGGDVVYARWLVGAILGFIVSIIYGAEAFLLQSGRI